jgi:hypothetical protein
MPPFGGIFFTTKVKEVFHGGRKRTAVVGYAILEIT